MDDVHPSHNPLPIESLDRYLTGEAAAEEQARVVAWSAEDARRVSLTALARREEHRDPEVEAAWIRIARKMEEHYGAWNPLTRRTRENMRFAAKNMRDERRPGESQNLTGEITGLRRRTPQWVAWSTAASVMIGVLGIIYGWHGGIRQLVWPEPRSVSTYATTDGQRANITLLDGTTVALNVASRLDIPADFAAGNHTVYLTGEALFTVSHHEGMPFTVVAGTTTARVLGTSFVVRHFPTDTVTTVAVRKGKVSVGSTILTEQQLLVVGPHGDGRIHAADPSLFAFATGVLTLNAMSLRDAIPELNRWYNADIRLSVPALAQRKIQGRIPAGSLSELAEMLEWTLNVRVVRDGRVLTLYPVVN